MVAFPINDALYNETRSALGTGLRCHVPGHGGQPWFGTISDRLAWLDTLTPFDTTELPGLDTLSDPVGIILESQTLVAQAYGAAHSFYLVNGASAGLHASLLALSWLKPNQPVLVARNAHRAVIAGLLLARLEPIWVLPSYDEDWHLWDGLTVDALEAAFRQHPHASAIVLPHPTYEGRPADIQRIASWAKAHSLVVIVDEAHGTLWPLIDGCPSALQAGADVVIHSAHKSAGSLTQTAVLHLGPGSALPKQAVGQALNLLHTSSPSYPLLASLEAALLYWASATGRQQLNHHMQRIHELEQWIDHTLTTLERHQHTGPLQCLLRVKPQPGQRIVEGQTLAEAMEACYGLRYEAISGMGVLLLLHGAFTDACFNRLKTGLVDCQTHPFETDPSATGTPTYSDNLQHLPEQVLSLADSQQKPTEVLPKHELTGRCAAQVYAPCPPGIAVVVPGERIEAGHLPWLPDSFSVIKGETP